MKQLEVLRTVTERLERAGIEYMLTGSFAMAFYAVPRMTRDLDIVIAAAPADAAVLARVFGPDFYMDADVARDAIVRTSLFNLMHFETGIKVDLIVRKDDEYRRVEFARRQRNTFAGIAVWLVSREDLILSKLVWARLSDSGLQRRDVAELLAGPIDRAYLERWAGVLGVADAIPGSP